MERLYKMKSNNDKYLIDMLDVRNGFISIETLFFFILMAMKKTMKTSREVQIRKVARKGKKDLKSLSSVYLQKQLLFRKSNICPAHFLFYKSRSLFRAQIFEIDVCHSKKKCKCKEICKYYV